MCAGSLNCAAFTAGMLEAVLNGANFVCVALLFVCLAFSSSNLEVYPVLGEKVHMQPFPHTPAYCCTDRCSVTHHSGSCYPLQTERSCNRNAVLPPTLAVVSLFRLTELQVQCYPLLWQLLVSSDSLNYKCSVTPYSGSC